MFDTTHFSIENNMTESTSFSGNMLYLSFHKLLDIQRYAVCFVPVKSHLGSFSDGFPVIFHRHIRSG